jgi:citrate lyase beta subunit
MLVLAYILGLNVIVLDIETAVALFERETEYKLKTNDFKNLFVCDNAARAHLAIMY